jgi:hypothetical protein
VAHLLYRRDRPKSGTSFFLGFPHFPNLFVWWGANLCPDRKFLSCKGETKPVNMATIDDIKRADLERRIKKGHGEIVEVAYTDLEDQVDPETGAVEAEVPVERINRYYVGKMTPQQTSGVISILGAIFVNGTTAKEVEGRQDNIAFLEFLDEYHLTLLLALVLGESRTWVAENWDTEWAMSVMGVFFRYNNFFKMLQSITTMVQGMGVTEQQARAAALGKRG